MSSSYGENIRLSIFGESHSPSVGMVLEGIRAGEKLDSDKLLRFLARRAPGTREYSTARREADAPVFLSGIKNGVFTGTPVCAVIQNTDTRSSDYEQFKRIPRPGHADYTAQIKYFGHQDSAGGGHFSGRLTAPMCVAGGILIQLLENEGIRIFSRIYSIGGILDTGTLDAPTADKAFPTVNDEKGAQMLALIAEKRAADDSVGGVIEVCAKNLPAGLGDPMFDGMENRIARAVFAIPAVKGIEFGSGFAGANSCGSENNDAFYSDNGRIYTKTNNAGGILGGITNGMDLTFRAAVKPTPSIALPQDSIDMQTCEKAVLSVQGRHDPCIVPRAVPCMEAACALAVYDALLGRRKETHP